MFLPIIFLEALSPVLVSLQKEDAKETKPTSYLLKETCDQGRFNTSASFLYWQAIEDGLEFAATNTPRFPASDAMPTDLSANLLTLNFAWEPAFKFLLGYHFASPDWDLNTRWTCFYSRSNRSASHPLSSDGAGLFPLWIPQQAAISTHPVYSSAKGTLLLHFNTIDFELAYSGGISKALFLTLHGGLKGVSIDQKLRVGYFDGFSDGTHEMISSHAHVKNKCSGIGPRIGFGSKWLLPQGCAFIAEGAAAFALSHMKTNREDHSVGQTLGAIDNIQAKLHEAFWVWRPLIETKAGFQWTLCFGQYRSLQLEAAYELQHYWEQNMMIRYADSAVFSAFFNSRGNLILQGLSLSATLGY